MSRYRLDIYRYKPQKSRHSKAGSSLFDVVISESQKTSQIRARFSAAVFSDHLAQVSKHQSRLWIESIQLGLVPAAEEAQQVRRVVDEFRGQMYICVIDQEVIGVWKLSVNSECIESGIFLQHFNIVSIDFFVFSILKKFVLL